MYSHVQHLASLVKVGIVDAVKVQPSLAVYRKWLDVVRILRVVMGDGQGADLQHREALHAAQEQDLLPLTERQLGKRHPQCIRKVEKRLAAAHQAALGMIYGDPAHVCPPQVQHPDMDNIPYRYLLLNGWRGGTLCTRIVV